MAGSWKQTRFVAFDVETSGAFPLSAEICEVAAVKWENGQIIDSFQSLIKTREKMSDFIIGIHGITNEMLVGAPAISEIIPQFRAFIDDSILIAHHAPFDLGFLALEFERAQLSLPRKSVLCSSLLSIKLFPELESHRLQSLIKVLNIPQGQAHRALDDSKACLEVAIKCMEKVGPEATIDEISHLQGGHIYWNRFSMNDLKKTEIFLNLITAIEQGKNVNVVYKGGGAPGTSRILKPLGVVRTLKGDYFQGIPENEEQSKRYYLQRVAKLDIVS